MFPQAAFTDYLFACPACAGSSIKPWLSKIKDGFQHHLWICDLCQTGFMNPQPSKEFMEYYYSKSGHGLSRPISLDQVLAAESEYPNATVDSKRLIKYSRKLLGGKQNLTALDVGSGYGFFSKTAIEEGFKVIPINPASWENDIFEKFNGFRPIERLFEDVDLGMHRFDLVILSHVLEHFKDSYHTLTILYNIMNKHGVLAIEVPNFKSFSVKLLKTKDNSCLLVPDHMTFYTKKGLISILSRAGFNVKRHIYVSRMPYTFFSNKLHLRGNGRKLINIFCKYLQIVPAKAINFFGMGISHDIWAQVD